MQRNYTEYIIGLHIKVEHYQSSGHVNVDVNLPSILLVANVVVEIENVFHIYLTAMSKYSHLSF